MKTLRIIAIVLVIAHALYNHILNLSYYNNLIEQLRYVNPLSLFDFSQYLLWILFDLLTIVCGILFLASPDPRRRNRGYVIFRFIYVVSSFFYLPQALYYITTGWHFGNFQYSMKAVLEFVVIQVTWMFCMVVLIMAKPEKPVQKIDLSNYELVIYTSTGHRLLHYLLDILFLLPIILFWMNYWPGLRKSPLGFELLFILVYFVYCFIAEAMFRQTFGKLITRSCIVSNGVQLSTGRIFIRTLSRLIPFDKLSFLFGGNWHDRVSATTVVYIDSWQQAFEEEKG